MAQPPPPAEWVILATTNAVADEDSTITFGTSSPPEVSVPVLAQQAGAKEPDYPDATVEAVAPTLWLLRYPPYVGTVPPLTTPCRYLVYNFGGLKGWQQPVTEIKHFPDGFFDDLMKAGVVADPTEKGYFVVADLRAFDHDGSVFTNTQVVREINYLFHDSAPYKPASNWQIKQYPGLPSDKTWKWEEVVSPTASCGG